jgi:hypothetical protein
MSVHLLGMATARASCVSPTHEWIALHRSSVQVMSEVIVYAALFRHSERVRERHEWLKGPVVH